MGWLKPAPSNCIPFTIFTSHGKSSSPWHDICCSGVTGTNGSCGSHEKALGGANRFMKGEVAMFDSMVEEWWIIRGKQLVCYRISYRSLEAYRCGSSSHSPAFRNGSSHFKEEFDSLWLTSSPTYQHSGCLGTGWKLRYRYGVKTYYISNISIQQSCLAWGLLFSMIQSASNQSLKWDEICFCSVVVEWILLSAKLSNSAITQPQRSGWMEPLQYSPVVWHQ